MRCFSQHGEDGVIAEILARVGTANSFFVEFGAQDGREANCVFLADILGWAGLFIEADQVSFGSLERKYSGNPAVTTLQAQVSPPNFESLLTAARVPAEPDVLSIDVDGQDYWIWRALNGWRPRIVVIEYNSRLPPGRALVEPRDDAAAWGGTAYFGASLDALCALGASKGYHLVHTDLAAVNAFFVRGDIAADRFPPAHAVPRRHEPNYFMAGYSHPADVSGREYVDPSSLDSRAKLSPASPNQLDALVRRTDFMWHQRFAVAPGIYTPGVNDVQFLLELAKVPERLDGRTVIDIGTTNGGAAFACEARGASRVIAVDIADENWFGFAAIKAALGSDVEHLQASVYELPELLREQFDVVMFWGVLYHLRHPLLGLDCVRRLARGTASIETAVSDHELPDRRGTPVVRFYRKDELAGDSSNWFAPTVVALSDWCVSCGLHPEEVRAWPETAPSRAMVIAIPTEPEYLALSYERPLDASVHEHGAYFGT